MATDCEFCEAISKREIDLLEEMKQDRAEIAALRKVLGRLKNRSFHVHQILDHEREWNDCNRAPCEKDRAALAPKKGGGDGNFGF